VPIPSGHAASQQGWRNRTIDKREINVFNFLKKKPAPVQNPSISELLGTYYTPEELGKKYGRPAFGTLGAEPLTADEQFEEDEDSFDFDVQDATLQVTVLNGETGDEVFTQLMSGVLELADAIDSYGGFYSSSYDHIVLDVKKV
jgi:hypothetical protein